MKPVKLCDRINFMIGIIYRITLFNAETSMVSNYKVLTDSTSL